MAIELIYDGEYGKTIRPKLNALIERINQISNLSTMLQDVESALDDSGAMMNEVRQELMSMRSLAAALQSKAYLSPTRMELTYPADISIRNSMPQRIMALLLPGYSLQNVLIFPAGGDAVESDLSGLLSIRHLGTAKFHVVPTIATHLYQTINITVRNPYLRKLSGGRLRKTSAGHLRIV
jgi:hypothetical protein